MDASAGSVLKVLILLGRQITANLDIVAWLAFFIFHLQPYISNFNITDFR